MPIFTLEICLNYVLFMTSLVSIAGACFGLP